jgi:hypothetical protein
MNVPLTLVAAIWRSGPPSHILTVLSVLASFSESTRSFPADVLPI